MSGLDAAAGGAIAALRSFQARTDGQAIAEWSLVLEEREVVALGAKDNQIGGVYAPPKVMRELSGDLYVLWKEKLEGSSAVSRTSVDALWLRDVPASLRRLRARAYPEKFVVDLPEDRPLPDVAIYDEKVADVVRRDTSFGFDALAELRPRLTRVKAAYESDFAAAVIRRRVASSRGLDRETLSTSMSFSASADSLFGVHVSQRRLLPREAITSRLDRLNDWLPHFAPTDTAESGERETILLLPGAAASFLSHFVLGNLDGEAIANGQSAWSAADFGARRRVFSEKLSLRFDPLEDWRSWSYRLDRRGLPAESKTYIEAGALASPIVSLKAAKQLSCAPSPVPSPSGLGVFAASSVDLDRHVASLDRAVIVPDVLGMHTQDAARGNYSLSVPHALVVRGGKIVGARKAVLSGNFFDVLGGDVAALSTPVDTSSGLAFEGTIKLT